MNKKGDFGWEEISKILLVLIILGIIIIIVIYLKGRGKDLVTEIVNILRFSK